MRLPTLLLAAATFTLGGLILPGAAAQVATAPVATAAPSAQELKTIRTDAYHAGFRDGKSDYQNHLQYNFQGHPVYESADQGYAPGGVVDQTTFQMNFRSGYEAGYDDGFYGRSENPNAQRSRTYNAGGTPARAAAQPGARAEAGTGTLPAGTALDLKLNNTISTRSSQQGDNFTATVAAPVYSTSGDVLLVPQGSTVAGTVASVQRSGSVSGKSQLQLNFQTLNLPDGSRLPLRAQVSQVGQGGGIGGAITGAPSTTAEGGVQQSQTRNTVGTAAAGGAVGALIGAIAGGGKGAGIGGLVGAGLGVVLASQRGNLDLPAGTPMTVTLSQPVQIR